MRTHAFIPAALVGLSLAAQAPADLTSKFNQAVSGVTQALQDARFKEALERADALACPLPAFKGSTLQEIQRSSSDGLGMMGILKLQAMARGAIGEWEKARELQVQRAAFGRQLTADLKGALAAQESRLRMEAEAAEAFAKENAPKVAAIEKRLDTLRGEIKAFNEKKLTLDAKKLEDLKARAAKAPADEQELADLQGQLAEGEVARKRLPVFLDASRDFTKDLENQVKDADAQVASAETDIKAQTEEIAAFNRKQAGKKPKTPAGGPKAWVDALMRNPANLSKFPSRTAQASFLYRLHVLDPENAAVNQALANIEKGLDPLHQDRPAKAKRK